MKTQTHAHNTHTHTHTQMHMIQYDTKMRSDTCQTHTHKQVQILPRNRNQETYMLKLLDARKDIVFGIGPAGTGKTLLAVQVAIKNFKEGLFDEDYNYCFPKILITYYREYFKYKNFRITTRKISI